MPKKISYRSKDKNQRLFYLVLNSSGYFSTFLFGMLFWATDSASYLQTVALAFFIIYILLGFAIRIISDLLLLFRISIFVSLVAFFLQILFTGGLFSPSLPQLMIIPILALFYKPKADRFILFSLTLIAAGLIAFLTDQNIWVRQGVPQEYMKLYTVCTFAYVSMIIFTFIVLFRNFITSSNKKLGVSMNELKRTTQQLVDSEKMASLGQMMAGIAHEINNPINYVKGSGDELRKHLEVISAFEKQRNEQLKEIENETDAEVFRKKYFAVKTELDRYKEAEGYDQDFFELLTDLTETIRIGTTKTADIVSSLRMYARQKSGLEEEIDVNRSIKTAVKILKHKMLDPRSVQLHLDELRPLIMGNEGRISQVFLNMIGNAMDAARETGQVIVTTKVPAEGNLLLVEIKDNGTGIPHEIQHKIFDPFFTTKEVGEGTGLGLSISRSIIEEHQGELSYDTDSSGTTFTITFPLC